MTWSLQLRNGDLAIDRDRFNTVTDWRKLVQDLRIRLLTRLGTDDLHPDFGSTLDGGTRIDGLEIPSIIGESDQLVAKSFITSEVRRILAEYQQSQANRKRADILSFGKSTLTTSEILNGADINVVFDADLVVVQIVVQTGEGEEKRISLPFNV